MKLSDKKKLMANKMYDQAGSKVGKGAPSGLGEYKGKKGEGSRNRASGKNEGEKMYLGKNEQEKP